MTDANVVVNTPEDVLQMQADFNKANEVAARALCRLRNLDPDEKVPHSISLINGRDTFRLRWHGVVEELLHHAEMKSALGLRDAILEQMYAQRQEAPPV